MKKTTFITALILSFGTFTFAAEKDEKDSPSYKYMLAIRDDVHAVSKLSDKFKTNPELFCPASTGDDKSACMREYISGLKIKSSTSLVILLTQTVQVSALPSKEGPANARRFAVLENIILLFENTDFDRFYLAELTAPTAPEKQEISMLKADDEKEFKAFFGKVSKSLAEKIKGIENSKELKTSPADQTRLQDLKLRFKKLKARSWKYSQV